MLRARHRTVTQNDDDISLQSLDHLSYIQPAYVQGRPPQDKDANSGEEGELSPHQAEFAFDSVKHHQGDSSRTSADSRPVSTCSTSRPQSSEMARQGTVSSFGSKVKLLPPVEASGTNNIDDEEDNSPFPEVRASVSNLDDAELPVLTFRALSLGSIFCLLGSSLNVFFNFRYPAPYISPLLIQLVSYPAGKFLALCLPFTVYQVPQWVPFVGLYQWSFNPGPFNVKEHALVTIMANVSIHSAYALNVVVTQELFYSHSFGIGFNFLLILSTQCVGFGLAGFCRRFLVWPASMIWPQILVVCTLFNTLHAEEPVTPGSIGRFKYFIYTSVAACIWYFVPGFLFKGLSAFSWVCWIWPASSRVNQLFGVSSGLGMSFLTLDWSQISYIGSPLVIPFWAEINIMIGFVVVYWIICPLLYFNNIWEFGYLPLSSTSAFDRFGLPYNITRILTPELTFDAAAYAEYSPLYLSSTFACVYILAFATSTCVVTHAILYHGKTLLNGLFNKNSEEDDVHARLMRNYPEVPNWWYAALFAFFVCLSIATVSGFPTKIPVWSLAICLSLPAIYILPAGFIYAITGQEISLNLLGQIIPGVMLPGNPTANIIFKTYAVQTMLEALSFLQDLKLGHYVKIPPRITFGVQCVACIISCFIQVLVKSLMFKYIPDLCQPHQKDGLVCPQNRVFFTSSVIWGVIGPDRFFGKGSIYQPQLWAMLFGALIPIPFYLYCRNRPHSIFRKLNWPTLLTGPTSIPPATGINYSSWFTVAFFFQFLLRRYNFRRWSKFNYVTSAALDAGTVVGVLLIFLTLQLRKSPVELRWWGNSVFRNTADWRGVSLLDIPAAGFGPEHVGAHHIRTVAELTKLKWTD